ncbi:hypothetical protein [Streptomyces lavendofoliae]|uniref:hypothetical protein n=1 Tax=Streptomyces lavendofoliae TaxID=67314 RepID=UPI003D924856
MRRRLAALLLAMVAALGLTVVAPQPAAAADGPIADGLQVVCHVAGGPVGQVIDGLSGFFDDGGQSLCDKIGDKGAKAVDEAWKGVWESVLGDVLKAGMHVVRWVIEKVLTVALMGPSVDLSATGLFGKNATLAGMLMWLGLVIAAFGVMWQLAKMAITGQAKHAGRAALGWVENLILSAVGVALFALLLAAGDALTAGLVEATFQNDDTAVDRVVAVMMPTAISNPVMVAGVIVALLLVGFIQLVMVFLRQSAIPIICLLLPVAGGGRTGGDATRQWAPKLITAGLVIVAYKPILAVIVCTGFSEFGKAQTLAEWLRGLATLVLGILAPGPLTKIFAPFGAAVGGGLASGGMGSAMSAAASFLGAKKAQGDGGEGAPPTSAVSHAQYVAQMMGSQNAQPDDPPASGGGGLAQGQDVSTHAGRGAAGVPGQRTGQSVEGGGGEGGGESPADTSGTATTSGGEGTAGTPKAPSSGTAPSPGAATATTAVGGAIVVLDGVNNVVQGASGQMGEEGI